MMSYHQDVSHHDLPHLNLIHGVVSYHRERLFTLYSALQKYFIKYYFNENISSTNYFIKNYFIKIQSKLVKFCWLRKKLNYEITFVLETLSSGLWCWPTSVWRIIQFQTNKWNFRNREGKISSYSYDVKFVNLQ